jgi:chlorophyllide a reductase subunit X
MRPRTSCAPKPRSSPTRSPAAPVTKDTQIIAIYGKGGIGKSFTLANLSYMMAQQGKKVLLIGCDPKSDTTSLLFGGKACPTIIETSSKKKLAGEAVAIGDVCFKRDGVYAMELGGPEVGRGCGGRGIIHGFETLEKLGFHDWGFDYVLLDFLGDVVCGGFGLPIARDMCQKVIVVGQQRPAEPVRGQQRVQRGRVLPQARRQRRRGRHGDQQGRRHRRGAGLCRQRRHPGAGHHPGQRGHPPQERQLRDHRPPRHALGAAVRELATNVAEAPPVRPKPQTQDQLLGLFSAESPGRDFKMEPATLFDMVGKTEIVKPTLEVVYDA